MDIDIVPFTYVINMHFPFSIMDLEKKVCWKSERGEDHSFIIDLDGCKAGNKCIVTTYDPESEQIRETFPFWNNKDDYIYSDQVEQCGKYLVTSVLWDGSIVLFCHDRLQLLTPDEIKNYYTRSARSGSLSNNVN